MAKRKLAEVRLTSILPHLLISDSSVDTNHNRLMHKRVLSTTGVYKYVYKVCIKVLIKPFSQRWQTVPVPSTMCACRGVIHISCEHGAVNRKRCFADCMCISVDKYCKILIINRQLSPVMVEKYVYKAGIKVLSWHRGGYACGECACLSRGRGNGRVAAASFARFQNKASLHCEQGLFAR